MIRVRRRVSRIVCAGAFVAVVLALQMPSVGQSMSRGSPQTPAGNARNPSPRRRTPYYRPQSGAEVQEVRIKGNRYVSVDKIRSYLKTRSNRVFDPQLVQADVRKLGGR